FDFLRHVIRLYGVFMKATVNNDQEADQPGPAEIDNLIQGRAHGSAGKKHVVNEDDVFAGHIKVYVGSSNDGLWTQGAEIIAVEGDVYLAHGHLLVMFFPQNRGEALGDIDAAGAYAHENQVRTVGEIA